LPVISNERSKEKYTAPKKPDSKEKARIAPEALREGVTVAKLSREYDIVHTILDYKN
jgi:transposase-like protein